MIKILLYLLMINPSVLSANLTGLVGISPTQPYNPEYQILSPENMKSRSGYFITDNPYCKVEIIKDAMDYAQINQTDFNNWLKLKLSTSIVSVANSVFNENDFITRQPFYVRALNKVSQTPTIPPTKNADGNYTNTYVLPNGFSGYWIQVDQDNNVAFCIKRIMLEFNRTGGTGTFPLYMFNTSDVTTPVYTQSITITGPIQEVELLDQNGIANGWVLDNTLKGKGYKGDYYIGFFQNDMAIAGLEPFQRQYREAALMSEVKDIVYYRCNFSGFTSLTAPFDLVGYTPYAWYNGLNPDVTVYKDFTDLVTQNERLFARAIQLKAQIDFLTESIASIRSNRNQRISESGVRDMMLAIEGQKGEGLMTVQGLRPQLYGAISSIQKELSKLQTSYLGENLLKVETLS